MSKRKRPQDLPDDIVFEILIRLEADVRTLHRLRCVSWQWYRIICRPRFQEEHYRRRCQRSSLLLETQHDPPNRIMRFNIYSNDRNLINAFCCKVPRSIQDSNYHMIQSFRGLVCFTPFQCEQILICNPSTSEQLALPISSTHEFSECICVGFGFSELIKKIKVFRFIFQSVDNSCLSEVFTLGTSHSWRTASPPPYMPRFHAPLLHGALHLIPLVCQAVQVELVHFIAVLDVDTEEYRQISLPDVYFGRASSLIEENDRLRLVELRGYLCLALDFWETEKKLEIWFLRDYLGDKWEKKYAIDLSSIGSCNGAFPLAIMDDECILLDVALWTLYELILYNPQGQCFSMMNRRNFSARLYCESLFGLTRTGFNGPDAAILPPGNGNLQQNLQISRTLILVRDYLIADPFVPYTSVLFGIFMCKTDVFVERDTLAEYKLKIKYDLFLLDCRYNQNLHSKNFAPKDRPPIMDSPHFVPSAQLNNKWMENSRSELHKVTYIIWLGTM